MNPPSPFPANGPILGLSGQENPAPPPGTPRMDTPNRQNTLEDRMETLQREMIKMQEHNNILSSKLDDTQKQLHEQESRPAQPPRGLEQTRQPRHEHSQRSSTTIGSARRNDRRQGRPTEREDQLQGGPRTMEHFGTDLPPTDPTIRLLLQKVNRIEEEQNQTRTPAWGKVQLGPFTSRI
ncbi:unnamed protein product [Prunus brigantina]